MKTMMDMKNSHYLMTNTKHEYKDKEQCKIHFLVDSLDTIKKGV